MRYLNIKTGGGADLSVLRRISPVVLLAFGWSYAATKLPVLKVYLPKVGGFGDFSLLAFVGIYLTARTCRYCGVDHKVTSWQLMLLALVSGVFCWIGLGHYHSPFAVAFAGAMFLLFKRLPIDRMKWVSNAVLWLSASTFSIYLLHRNKMGMAWMRHFEDVYIAERGCNYYAVCFYCAIVFFFGALALDLPRRLFALMSRKLASSAGGGC